MSLPEVDALFLKRVAELDRSRAAHFPSIASRIDTSGECWPWRGCINTKLGYGVLCVKGLSDYAHRHAYRIAFGEPGSLFVCHHCDSRYEPGDKAYRRCMRPSHLFLGTAADNSRDAAEKNRVAYGERSGVAKISADDAREIAARLAAGERVLAVARDYGLSYANVAQIRRGESWKRDVGDVDMPQWKPARGSECGGAKLTEDRVAEIRARLATGARGIDLAREFGVHESTICRIRRGNRWQHVAVNDSAKESA